MVLFVFLCLCYCSHILVTDVCWTDITIVAADTILPRRGRYGGFCQRAEESLQGKRKNDLSYRDGGALDGGIEQSIRRAKGGGESLEPGVQRQMESGFGASFGGVRIHRDAMADNLTRSIQAKAFTTGKDIFFKRGEYNPGSSAGKELLAHELTHTVQQGAVGV